MSLYNLPLKKYAQEYFLRQCLLFGLNASGLVAAVITTTTISAIMVMMMT